LNRGESVAFCAFKASEKPVGWSEKAREGNCRWYGRLIELLKLLMQNHPKTCCRCGLRKPGMSKMRVIFAQATELLYLCSKINSIQIPDRYMAEENSLLDKLDGLKSRFEEISTLITDPSVIGDQGRYVKLSKEYKDLERLMNARTEYAALLRDQIIELRGEK